MENKKKIMIAFISILVVSTLMLVGLTYAYYRTRVVGNKAEESINVSSEVLEVTYSDDKSVITADKVKLGYTATKNFDVENTGDDVATYNIILDNVNNSFELAGWEYTLYRILKDGSEEFITSKKITTEDKQIVLENISIDSGDIHKYNMKLVYSDIGDDQSKDMGKSISFRVNITGAMSTSGETEEKITIVYQGNADNVENIPPTEMIVVGENYTIVTQEPTRSGYKFIRWNMSKNCDGVSMEPGAKLENLTNNVVLYACWGYAENITITYDGNSQSATNVPESVTVAYGSEYTLSTQIPTMDAGTFYKWNTSKSCDGKMIDPGTVLSNLTNNVTLYACWQMQTG